MRKLQNIVSNFGTHFVRQGNQLVVRLESLRSLRASFLSALSYCASELAAMSYDIVLRDGAWQALCTTWIKSPVGTVGSPALFSNGIAIIDVAGPDQRRHRIMCHRTAA